MAVRKTPGDYPLSNFRHDVAENRISNLYILWGEETYLRDYYVTELINKLADGDETGVRILNGKECTPRLWQMPC